MKYLMLYHYTSFEASNSILQNAPSERGLCFNSSGQPVYITKRFDVVGGVKDFERFAKGFAYRKSVLIWF